MSAIQSKGHITIDGYLFLLAKMTRGDRHIYGREESPHFVNKFSSGDPNYRDSTFFPHWVQNNWLNGFNQEKFNDGGKFYRSSGVDTTQQEKLTLQKLFSSAGQTASGVNVLCQEAWRSSAYSAFGTGADGALTISTNTTDAPIDSACTGTLGSTTLSATNASFVANQVILIHQTRGTSVGTWQKTKITNYVAGTITTEDPLSITYTTGAQVLVLKQYTSVTVNSGITWTAKAWDGTVGGILAFLCSGAVTVTGSIVATGKGFLNKATGSYQDTTFQGEGTAGAGSSVATANGNGGGGGLGGANQGNGGGGGHAAAGSDGSGGSTTNGTGGTSVGNASLTSLNFGGAGGTGGFKDTSSGTHTRSGNGGGIVFIISSTLTVDNTTGSIVASGSNGENEVTNHNCDGGGAGGSILIKAGSATLNTSRVTAAGGTGGTGANGSGGAGSVGRIHVDYSTAVTGTTSPTLDSAIDGTLTVTPGGSSFTHIVGTSSGKIYSWDGSTTYTELFDTRRLTWYDSGNDDSMIIGDSGGTERAQAQSFQLSATTNIKGIELYLKKNAGTPGDITVRIETNNAGVPSGTLVNANLTTTIPAFTGTDLAWKTVNFSTSVSLTASTTYWVVMTVAAAANDNNYVLAADGSSPSYTSGNLASSSNGGSTWTADSTRDAMFRVLGNTASANCMMISSVSGSRKLYIGSGDQASTSNGDARLYSYDGTTFVLVKTFNTTDEMCVLSMAEYGSLTTRAYIGLGARAKVYVTSDFSTFTLSKTIINPSNPGYVYCLKEYNKRLYAGGGYPEQLYGNNNQFLGFVYSYDEYSWEKIGSFEHTVVKSMEVYDNLLFVGTIKKNFYVYNTASIDKLLEFPWDVQMTSLFKWNDKLAITLAPTPGSAASGFESIYLFDRNGFHSAFSVTSRSWYSISVFNNNLMAGNDDGYVYQTSATTYGASGTLQTSYFEASLPGIDKKERSLILQYESLLTGCSILAEYKTDEADASWTTIGTANVVASTQYEANFSDTFYSKKISIRLTLATSVAASTPTLKVMDMRYVLIPDFKYLWKMKLACPDNIIWMDGTEPISTTTAASISAGATSLVLNDASGFPTKGRAVLVDGSTEDEFTWTGKSSNTLTGIPATGSLALSVHSSTSYTVKMTARTMHNTILTMKQTKSLFAFVDIDEISYNVLFHQYQADNFVVNQTDGIENDVPITLLEA